MHRLLLLLGLALGCSGSLLGERAFDARGDVDWSVELPGDAALWLRYELRAPSARDFPGAELEPRYDLQGQLRVELGGSTLYDGGLRLRERGAALDGRSSSLRTGGKLHCDGASCQVSGRIKLLDLEGMEEGAPLHVQAHLPLSACGAVVKELALELRD